MAWPNKLQKNQGLSADFYHKRDGDYEVHRVNIIPDLEMMINSNVDDTKAGIRKYIKDASYYSNGISNKILLYPNFY